MNELRRRVRAEQSVPRFEPCLPRPADEPPAGPGWIHEIKHDGFRILAHRRGRSTRLFSRNGHNFADRFPLIAEAIEALPVRSCVVDGEAIVCGDRGLAVFDLIRGHATNAGAVLCAFDLLERAAHRNEKPRLAPPSTLIRDVARLVVSRLICSLRDSSPVPQRQLS
jgi:ATP-dependent DNA ligase